VEIPRHCEEVRRGKQWIVANSATEFNANCFVNSQRINEGTPKGRNNLVVKQI
jgi:hypothetical protein